MLQIGNAAPGRRHLLALGALLAVTLLYYHQLVFGDRILVGYDVFTYFYPNEQFASDALRAGRLPLWNPYLFTGVPFLANPQTGIFYPPNLLFLFMTVGRAYGYSIVLHVFLAAAFGYAFGLVTLRLRPLPAFITGAGYAFSGFLGALSGHLNQLQASAWLPLLLLVAEAAYRRRSGRLALAGALVVAMQFLAGHMQEFYMSMLALALFVAWLAVSDGRAAGSWRRPAAGLLPIALMVGLGVALCAVQALPSYELTGESIRAGGLSYEEAVHFSLPPWLLLRALLPAFGDPQPYSEWIGYVGLGTMLLAAYGALRSPRHRLCAFFMALAALALLLALGQFNPAYPLLYRLLPGLKLFRVPARWLLLYTLALAAMGGIGAQALGKGDVASWHRLKPMLPRGAFGPNSLRMALDQALRPAALITVLGVALLLLALMPNPRGVRELPSGGTAGAWGGVLLGAAVIVVLAERRAGRLAPALAALLVGGELLIAGQWMDSQRVNLPEAYSALRPAVAYLLANAGGYRVLPLSEGSFDPGDLAQLKAMVGPVLPPEGVYDYVVAAKHKDTLTPNLPLRYGIASLDGYDGGVLPLRRYVDVKRLLPLATANTPDGRLREQLTTVPDIGLLSWLNVRYVAMDRLRDVWVDGVYYDLGLSRPLAAGAVLTLPAGGNQQATTVGIISHLRGAGALADGAPVATVTIRTRSGRVYTTALRAGIDSAEGRYAAPDGGGKVAHRQARQAKSWRDEPDAWDYVTTLRLPEPDYVESVQVAAAGDGGQFVLRGLSVIDERRQLSYPVVIDPDLRLSYLGDVKIYENQKVLPRAFLVHDAVTVPGDDAALPAMEQSGVDLTREAVLTAAEGAKVPAAISDGIGLAAESARLKPQPPSDSGQHLEQPVGDRVAVVEYAPERVAVKTASAAGGLLILTDSDYPGWRALVDGQPAPVLRVDHLFRAVALPAGEHEVSFEYEPGSLQWGGAISVVALAVVLAGLAFGRTRGSSGR